MYTCKNEFIQHTILNKYNFGDIAIQKYSINNNNYDIYIYILKTVEDSSSRPLATKRYQFPLHRWQLAPLDPEATR